LSDKEIGVALVSPEGSPWVFLVNTEMGRALADATVRARLLEVAQEPVGGSAEHFARVIKDDFEKYGRLAKELKIKAE
jgi:tripartite-type tricarboxylate transporter receptor subunit TctC